MVENNFAVLRAEREFFEKANPHKNGNVEINGKDQEDREDVIVRKLSKGGVLIFGGAHVSRTTSSDADGTSEVGMPHESTLNT